MSYNELVSRGTADFPIELYNIDMSDPRYDMVAHWHTEVEIVRIISGNLNIELNNHTYVGEKGDIFFINPEMVHSANPQLCEYDCVVFDPAFLSVQCEGCKYFIESLIQGEYIVNEFISSKDTGVYDVATKLFELMKKKSTGYKFKVIGALYELFGEIIDRKMYTHIVGDAEIISNKNTAKLKQVLEFIHKNYSKQISLNDMARAADMSPKYFCYFFKEMTKKTPVEYLRSYRIEKASRMLLNGGKSVTEVAFENGFNDLSYFIKTFKEDKGVTPSKFKKNN